MSGFRPSSPLLNQLQEGAEYNSPLSNSTKNTKSQLGLTHLSIGVGASSFSSANFRNNIITQKESDLNFSKMVYQ